MRTTPKASTEFGVRRDMICEPQGDDSPPQRVLIVEALAHLTYGHMPNRCVELARAFASAGCSVRVLTARGWSGAHGQDGSTPEPFEVLTYAGPARALSWLAEALRPPPVWRRRAAVRSADRRLGRAVREVRSVLASVAALLAVRRELDGRGPEAIVMLNVDFDPRYALANGSPHRWLVNVYRPPSVRLPSALNSMLTRRLGARSAQGRSVAVSAPSEAIAAAWREEVPGLDVRVLPLAGARPTERTTGARESLGIPPEAQVALLFGAIHPERDSAPIVSAFERLPQWHLLVAGQQADAVQFPAAAWVDERVHVRPGRVSNEMRDRLYSAADVVLLSFVDGYERNSGTLMDAISCGVPVACSQSSAAGRLVLQYQLGGTFAAGQGDDLARLLAHGVPAMSAQGLERARAELGNDAVVRQLLPFLTTPSGT